MKERRKKGELDESLLKKWEDSRRMGTCTACGDYLPLDHTDNCRSCHDLFTYMMDKLESGRAGNTARADIGREISPIKKRGSMTKRDTAG